MRDFRLRAGYRARINGSWEGLTGGCQCRRLDLTSQRYAIEICERFTIKAAATAFAAVWLL